MKKCPRCKRTYADESFSFCLDDGALLSSTLDPDATLTASVDPEATLISRGESSSEQASIVRVEYPVIAININQQYPLARNAEDLYNCTRGMWRLNRERAARAKYFFAVYRGVIKEVYELDRCIPSTRKTREYWDKRLLSQGKSVPPEVNEGRSELIGRIASEKIRARFIGRLLPVRHGQNAIRYINC